VVSRLDAPVFGAIGQSYSAPQRFSFTSSWRYSKSDRHYVGRHYQRQRDEEGSQVINRVSTEDFNFKWNINDRWNLGASLPYQRATRSSGLRDPVTRKIVARSDYRSDGIGDMVITARHWILNPATHRTGNLQIGFGLKLPTGNSTEKAYRYSLVHGVSTRNATQSYNDRSVQPGDGGGIGYLIDFSWFQSVFKGHMTFYTSAGYLFNPKEKNHATGNSVPDQYVGRVGAIFSGPKWHGIGVGLGGRLEGSPYQDVFGGDTGGRRPGYSVAIEPSISWSHGPNSIALAVPYRMYANRTRSVSDRENGGHGDAAFADYVVLFSYTRRFGDRVKSSHAPPVDEAKPAEGKKSSCAPELNIKDEPSAASTTSSMPIGDEAEALVQRAMASIVPPA
jgi:hypothetical protein